MRERACHNVNVASGGALKWLNPEATVFYKWYFEWLCSQRAVTTLLGRGYHSPGELMEAGTTKQCSTFLHPCCGAGGLTSWWLLLLQSPTPQLTYQTQIALNFWGLLRFRSVLCCLSAFLATEDETAITYSFSYFRTSWMNNWASQGKTAWGEDCPVVKALGSFGTMSHAPCSARCLPV